MYRKLIVLCLFVFLFCISIAAWTQEKFQDRVVSERLICQIDLSSWIKESLIVSPDNKRIAYAVRVDNKQVVVVDGKMEKQYDGIGIGSLIFSLDSKHMAYVAAVSNKQFVVVDEKEGKQYDGIGSLIFSPDSKHVAYGARAGNKQFVVVDEKEGKQYDGIVKGGKIILDSPEALHYLAGKDRSIYLVEERIIR
jgi:hypothetical protein